MTRWSVRGPARTVVTIAVFVAVAVAVAVDVAVGIEQLWDWLPHHGHTVRPGRGARHLGDWPA